MKPMNFPARKLARQIAASKRAIAFVNPGHPDKGITSNEILTSNEFQSVIGARLIRSKIRRSKI